MKGELLWKVCQFFIKEGVYKYFDLQVIGSDCGDGCYYCCWSYVFFLYLVEFSSSMFFKNQKISQLFVFGDKSLDDFREEQDVVVDLGFYLEKV